MRNLTVGLALLVGASACSSSDQDGESETSGRVGDESNSGDPGSSGDDDEVIFEDPAGPGGETPSDGSLGEGEACVGSSAETERRPAVLQLLIDTSGSMGLSPQGEETRNGTTKWDVTRDALLTAIEQMPASTSLGIIFYPDGGSFLDCMDRDVDVPIRALGEAGSMHRTALAAAIEDVEPQGGTPTHDAYQFALGELAESDAEGNKFVVLITDGAPTYGLGCEGTGRRENPVDPAPLVPEAAAAQASDIGTFVIGSPGSELDGYQDIDPRITLSSMAEAGGTAALGCSAAGPDFCHFDMTQEEDFAAGLAQALADISGRVLSCVYDIPAPPQGSEIDLERVNVIYTPTGGMPERIAKDPTDACTTEGWRYSQDQTQVELCGATCERAQADINGRLEVQFGCRTEIRLQ